MGGIIVIGLVFMVIGMFVQWRLKSKFTEYSQIGLMNGLSGAEIADKMLRDNGIYDVRITQVDGQLTDHYNPAEKTVNLSYDVFNGRSVAAAAVAAHEVGHAVQHATAYGALKMRSAMVPAVNVAANLMNYANMFLFMGFGYSMLQGSSFGGIILMVIVAANVVLAGFALLTLPVEFDASKRALAWVEQRGVVNRNEHDMAKDALKWAALTYVVAAAGAMANLLYYASLLLGRRSND
ncbi:MAG: zinc metallopeptidase [Spirosomaceae bacterium]|nr:zinc metallopeptidase [Spirosomataceae bacterium]